MKTVADSSDNQLGETYPLISYSVCCYGAMTFNIMTFSIMDLVVTLSISI
jgi:hypothetical protein